MNRNHLFAIVFILIITIISNACSTSKKTVSQTAATPITTTTTPIVQGPTPNMISSEGYYAPGNEELIAIQKQFSEVNMQTLTDGYALYTGVCTNCHNANNIYFIPDET